MPNQARNPLSQRIIEALNMVGSAKRFANGEVLDSRNHPFVHHILVRVKGRLLTINLRNLVPQLSGADVTPIPDVKANDLATLGVHR